MFVVIVYCCFHVPQPAHAGIFYHSVLVSSVISYTNTPLFAGGKELIIDWVEMRTTVKVGVYRDQVVSG